MLSSHFSCLSNLNTVVKTINNENCTFSNFFCILQDDGDLGDAGFLGVDLMLFILKYLLRVAEDTYLCVFIVCSNFN